MLGLVWRAAYRDWQKVRVTYDSSFEAAILFSLLGLVVTALYLTNGLYTPTLVNAGTMLQVLP